MLLLTRALIAFVGAALFAAPIFISLCSGQISLHGWIIKRRQRPLTFWTIAAFNLLIALSLLAVGLGVLSGRF
jgi:hypothetical protein